MDHVTGCSQAALPKVRPSKNGYMNAYGELRHIAPTTCLVHIKKLVEEWAKSTSWRGENLLYVILQLVERKLELL